jgi:hypothetical protein
VILNSPPRIVPPRDTEFTAKWIQAVIPHEIAHLFFYQITHNPLASGPPTWLNEGFAQYHEFVSHADELAWVRRVAQSSELIPLRLASGSFSGDNERIALLYAESLSAVTFLSPPGAGVATVRPPDQRPTVPPAPTLSATPTAGAPAPSSGCVPCPCVGVLGLLSLLAVLGWRIFSR